MAESEAREWVLAEQKICTDGQKVSVFGKKNNIHSCSSFQISLLSARRCKPSTQTDTHSLASDSAIGLHLLQNPVFTQLFDDSRFSTLD